MRNTIITSITTFSIQEHPHVCGEYRLKRHPRHLKGVTSPRMWGIPTVEHLAPVSIRNIPTCGGESGYASIISHPRNIPTYVRNTERIIVNFYFKQEHPNVCGEYGQRTIRRVLMCGTSPRVWGTHTEYSIESIDMRNIPTCVGNTYTEIASTQRP